MSYVGTPPRKQTGGKILLQEQVAVTGTTNISFTENFDATYDLYEFHFINVHPETNGANLTWQVNAVGESGFNETMTTTAVRAYNSEAHDDNGLDYRSGEDQTQGTSYERLVDNVGNANDQSVSGILKIYEPHPSFLYAKHFMSEVVSVYNAPGTKHDLHTGYVNTQTALNQIDFKFSSGDIDAGIIRMYGIKFDPDVNTESKNIVWSVATDAPSTTNGIKFGTKSAGASLRGGGTTTDEWDGSSWSTGGSSSVDRGSGGGGGTQTAGVVYAGYHDSDESVTTEEYNGTSWSSGNNMAVGASGVSGSGPTQTWQICTGGSQYSPTVRDISSTQTYNGTNWTNESVSSDGRSTGGMTGVEDDVLFHHGSLDSPGAQNTVTYWNGSSWATKATAPVIGRYIGHFGSSTRAYRCGGYTQDALSAPNYYYRTGYATESWTDDVWTNENVIPFTINILNALTATNGEGWTASGDDKQATHSTTAYAYHWEASEF